MSESTVHSTKKSFISSVAWLAASAVAVKIIGAFYKLPLVRMIGIGGMAYFLAAYHIYTLLFTVSSAGLPVAVSILVSKRRAADDANGAECVYFSALRLFLTVGAVLCALTWICADAVALSIKIPGAADSLRAIAPALIFVSAGGAVKGYFQGLGDMRPTAVSQVIESAGKLALGLGFTALAQRAGLPSERVAACAIFGITVGSALSMIYLFAVKGRSSAARVPKKSRGVMREILKISAPITLGAVVISLSGVIDTALISSRLQSAGFSAEAANGMYSSYGNMAIPLFGIVPSFISPVAVAMAPLIVEAASRGDREREREILFSAFRLCALIAIPAAMGLGIFGRPILAWLFPSQLDSVAVAAPLLSVLSPAILFSCLITVTNSTLQAYGHERKPIVAMIFGMAVKLTVEFLLLGLPQINIFAAPISTLLCDLTIVMINLGFTEKYSCGISGLIPSLGRPLAAAALSSAVSLGIAYALRGHGFAGVLIAMIADVPIYLILTARSGAFDENELFLLPGGEKIIKIMNKFKLRKNNEQRREDRGPQG
ncbi:MAG: polysaccharide biosynthesis protein [Clostridia bacterium]|nr:polysaccharide biosynthesis protein [Clostridia bacterium]